MKKFILVPLFAISVACSVQAKDIVETAAATGFFKTLITALNAAGLNDTLKGEGPFTIFAPTDEAFAKIPKADLKAMLKDKAKLKAILTYHVVAEKIMSVDIAAGNVKTVQGSDLTIFNNYGIQVDKANITRVDITADNGVIHVIDKVIFPK